MKLVHLTLILWYCSTFLFTLQLHSVSMSLHFTLQLNSFLAFSCVQNSERWILKCIAYQWLLLHFKHKHYINKTFDAKMFFFSYFLCVLATYTFRVSLLFCTKMKKNMLRRKKINKLFEEKSSRWKYKNVQWILNVIWFFMCHVWSHGESQEKWLEAVYRETHTHTHTLWNCKRTKERNGAQRTQKVMWTTLLCYRWVICMSMVR